MFTELGITHTGTEDGRNTYVITGILQGMRIQTYRKYGRMKQWQADSARQAEQVLQRHGTHHVHAAMFNRDR